MNGDVSPVSDAGRGLAALEALAADCAEKDLVEALQRFALGADTQEGERAIEIIRRRVPWAAESAELRVRTAIEWGIKQLETATRAANPEDETHTGNAHRLARLYGAKIRYVADMAQWFIWTGWRWRLDPGGLEVLRFTEDVAAELKSDPKHEKWGKRSESRGNREATASLTRSLPGISITADALDAKPWQLNVGNGTIDLHTGRLGAHRPEHMLTKLADIEYNPAATCPRFDGFLADVFLERMALIAFVWRLIGMCLTGDVSAQVLPVFHGDGANGKSTLLDILLALLGEYAIPGAPDLLITRKHDQHPTELADLHGRRLVICQESGQGRSLNETRVKALTGGDRIKARRMREDFWFFDPTHKLILSTNHRPAIRGSDHGIWRRILLLPFEATFALEPREGQKKADPHILDKLKAELPGILAHAVRGCLEWQRIGLDPPAEVRAATDAYRDGEDRLQRFLDACCVMGPTQWVSSAGLISKYREWATEENETQLSQTALGTRLAKLSGVATRKQAGNRGWGGLGLVGSPELPVTTQLEMGVSP